MPYSLIFDTVIAILVIISYKNIRQGKYANVSFSFIGRHSFNIFLFHTFLYFLYIPQVIYWSRNPVIIFLTLLTLSLAVSVAIEYLKKISGFQKLEKRIIAKRRE